MQSTKCALIKVEHVTKKYNIYDTSSDRIREMFDFRGKSHHSEYIALNDISFSVDKGETFGVIGTNGAGKSTLLKIITGVANPSNGTVEVNGRISALLELGAGFNRNYTGIENIYLNGTMMGFSRQEMDSKIQAIIEFADIGEFINQPVRTYSSGMFARLAFAVAISIEPDILIVDEALSVGDVFFQNKCYRKFEELRSKGITILFVSHDIGTVKQLCSRVLWLDNGNCKMIGESVEVCNEYLNHILRKRNIEYDHEIHDREVIQEKQRRTFDLENFPKIQYTNESILNNEVEILSAFVTDCFGKRVAACEAEKKYVLSIIFKSEIEIQHCIAGFVMETVKGLWVINCNSISSGKEQPFHVNAGSLNRIDFEFEMPKIVNGDYVIGVAVSEGDETNFKVLTWLYGVLYIQITNVGNNDGILHLDADVSIYEREEEYE